MRMPNEDYGLAKKVSDISEQSTLVWGISYIALPKGGIWSFVDRKWQIDIMDDMAPNIVVMKPTQVGLTTIMTVKALWFVSHIRSRGMITFPRKDDVSDYVASTLDPIIEGSEALYTKMGKTDTVRLKRIGDSFLHIMEASVTPRMLPVDILMNDEIDLSNPDNLEQFVARLDVSAYKYHYRFSTPTVSGYGVDAEYERSDQREWVVKCTYCSKEQVLDWDRHLIIDERDDRPYYACEKCGQEFSIDPIINGVWVPMNPSSSIHGYHVSHMMLPFTRPPEKLYDESKVMDVRTFYNLRLGRPWRPIGGSIPPQVFKDYAFQKGHQKEEWPRKGETYFLGADQGNDAHIMIGRLTESGGIDVVYAEHVQPSSTDDHFERIGALMRLYNIRYGIIDANPNRVSAYKLCEEFDGSMSACDIGGLDYPFRFHGFTGSSAYKINANRTDMLDGLRDWLVEGRLQLWGSWETREPIVDEIINQCDALKRDTTTRRVQGGGEKVVGVWRKAGKDHFAFAFSLLRLAAIIDPGAHSFDFAVIGHDIGSANIKKRKSKVWKDLEYEIETGEGNNESTTIIR